jgi:aromatic ring hydroxylase
MGIRTAAQCRGSLKDGRSVYIRGEKVEDITAHPILGLSVETGAQGFELSNSPDPEIRNLFPAPTPGAGSR